MSGIRVMLVDDHEIVRTGLRSYLERQESIDVIAEASTGEEAISIMREARPDVIVMDLTMPGMGGIEAARRMAAQDPHVRVLVLTVHTDQQYFFEVMAAGAAGYVTKQSAAEDLIDAIRAVASGYVYLQPVLARWLLEDYRRLWGLYESHEQQVHVRQQYAAHLDVLSKRERQILTMVAESQSNQEIGEALGISPKTVARHRERIMNKLNFHSTMELVKFAVKTGLIEIT
jgi:two-component system, NarL family, response regulator NreC